MLSPYNGSEIHRNTHWSVKKGSNNFCSFLIRACSYVRLTRLERVFRLIRQRAITKSLSCKRKEVEQDYRVRANSQSPLLLHLDRRRQHENGQKLKIHLLRTIKKTASTFTARNTNAFAAIVQCSRPVPGTGSPTTRTSARGTIVITRTNHFKLPFL